MFEELEIGVLLVLSAIVISALTGLCAALRAIYRIHSEHKFLEREKNGKHGALTATSCDENVLRNWYDEMENKACGKRHLCRRVDTMLKALENDPTAVKELPELHDLHELTLQDELGRGSPATLRIVISFLLILGILGTLTGVHGVVGTDLGENLTGAMADALLPSMLAVGSTVVLMLLRGVYSAKVDAFLEELDFFTMTVLAPRLQPSSDIQRDKNSLAQAIDAFSNNTDKIGKASQTLQVFADSFEKDMENFQKETSSIDALLENAKVVERALEASGTPGEGGLGDRLAKLEADIQRLEGLNVSLGSSIEDLSMKSRAAQQEYEALCSTIEVSGARLQNGLDMVDELAHNTGAIKSYTDALNQYHQKVSTLFDKREAIRKVYEAVRADMQNIQASRKVANDLSTEVYQSAETLGKATESLQQFSARQYNVAEEKRAMDEQLNEMQESIKKLDQSRESLVLEFRNRANQIGLQQ